MVEIIPEPIDIDKNLFFESIENIANGIKLKVTRVSEVKKSKMNQKDIIFIDFLIDDVLKECFTYEKNDIGKMVKTTVDATNEIVSISFTLGDPENNKYLISKNSNIFPMLNYGLKVKGKIGKNNESSFKITYVELYEVLQELSFKATAEYITDTNFNPYYKLQVVNGDAI